MVIVVMVMVVMVMVVNGGGQRDGEDHGDGVGHRLVLLLLDGDDRPGVGHDGEHAHRQGEEKERWVEYLTRRNITYIEYEISTRRRSRKIDHGFGYKNSQCQGILKVLNLQRS